MVLPFESLAGSLANPWFLGAAFAGGVAGLLSLIAITLGRFSTLPTSSIGGAFAGAGKLVAGFAADQYRFWKGVGEDLFSDNLSGAVNKMGEGLSAFSGFFIDLARNHGIEIVAGAAIGAAIIFAAPVIVPIASAYLGLSTAAVTGSMIAVGAAAAGAYVATAYGPMLNRVNQSCGWFGGNSDCGYARYEAGQRLAADAAIGGISVKAGWKLSAGALAGKISERPLLRNAFEAMLAPRKVRAINDWEPLFNFDGGKRQAFGRYVPDGREIGYKKGRYVIYYGETSVGTFLHEIKHSTDHLKNGRALSALEAKIAHKYAFQIEVDNRQVLGYSRSKPMVDGQDIRNYIEPRDQREFMLDIPKGGQYIIPDNSHLIDKAKTALIPSGAEIASNGSGSK